MLISYLALDAGYDPIFDPAQSLTNAAAVSQVILTSLKLFLGEWWEDFNIGLPVFQKILGQLGSDKGQKAIKLVIQQHIEKTPYVTVVKDVAYDFVDGQFSFTATAETVFGTVTVSNIPGQSAGLNG